MIVRGRRQDGQGLVEFAVVLPVFMLILFGIFDVGFVVYTNSVLSQAAREGARLASTEVGWVGISGRACVADASAITAANPGAHVCPPDLSAFEADVERAVNGMAIGLGRITDVYLSCNTGALDDPVPTGDWTDAPGGGGNGCQDDAGNTLGSPGEVVSVRVDYTHDTFTPIVSSLFGSVPLSGSATMVVN